MADGLKTKIKFILTLSVLLLFVLLSLRCSVRKRSNIFDPKSGIDTLNMKLYLRAADSVISLEWFNPYNVDFSGYHLYRKTAGQTNFTSLAILDPGQTTYSDSSVQYDTPYSYYLTMIGASGESPPTHVLRTVPGPGTIWLLDRWNEYILKFSYDLHFTIQTHYAIWIPQALAMDRQKNLGMISYPLYHYVELFDLQSGKLYAEITSIRYPFACAFDPISDGFWITDSTGLLYRFAAGSHSLDLLDRQLKKPVAIAFSAEGMAFVLDKRARAIVVYNNDGTRQKTIGSFNGRQFEQLIFLTASPSKHFIYFIEQTPKTNILYRYSTLSDSVNRVVEWEGMTIARQSALDGTLWIAVNAQNGAKILQLSQQGLRLKTLDGFKYIEDFALNPVNGNIVIADRDLHRLIHLYPDGQAVGVYLNAPYPYKVYIE